MTAGKANSRLRVERIRDVHLRELGGGTDVARRRDMRHQPALLALLTIVLTACATDDGSDDIFLPEDQSLPTPSDGKADEPRACGADSCVPSLCGFDCTTPGAQCTSSCAPTDTNENTFVAAEVHGEPSFDSRDFAYEPVFSLDNVLIYGCNVWDFTGADYDGFAVQYEELQHASFVVDPNDPTRHDQAFYMYIGKITGPGSYVANARYAASDRGAQYSGANACSVDISSDGNRGLTGKFQCGLEDSRGTRITLDGSFACGQSSMRFLFSKWPH